MINQPFVMPPFWNMLWRSTKIKQEWEPLLSKIRQANYFAEYESVKRGYRDCDVYHVYPYNFDTDLQKIIDDELFYQPILRSQKYDGGGHIHYMAKDLGPNTFVYGVVSNSKEGAEKFKEYSIPGNIDHKIVGQLLGYPDCCIDWFTEEWLTQKKADPMFETAMNTSGCEVDGDTVTVSGPPELNRLSRYVGLSALPYYTCSFDCKPSMEFAGWWEKLMREYDEHAYDKLIEALNMPVTWSVNNYLVYVEHPLFRATANGFDVDKKYTVNWKPE